MEEDKKNQRNIEIDVKNEKINSKDVEIADLDNKKSKKQDIIMFIKFLCFSLSAGVIQLGSFELMYHVIGWENWWATYLISITLSVIWNFTFNRKFTFKSANNVPKAMLLVLLYYIVFIPISVFGGEALENVGWHETLVTVMMMIINFVTEYAFDRFVVFKKSINTNNLANKN